MKKKDFKKFVLLIAVASLLNACNINPSNEIFSSSEELSSSNASSNSTIDEPSSIQPISSSSLSSESTSSSSEKELSIDSKTCDNHIPQEEIVEPATIINKGIKRATCPNCGGFTESYYYDLD